MSNLQNFFSGGGSGGVPLRGLVPFPQSTPAKVVSGGQVYLRSGRSEPVDFDPSLQSWVDDNIMFVNTATHNSIEINTWGNRSAAVDTDGQGRWMVGGWQYRPTPTTPQLYYSSDDGVTWNPLAIPIVNTSQIVADIHSGGNGVWIVTATGNGVTMFRTTNNGASWTDITTTAMPSGSSGFKTIECNRNGIWVIGFGSNQTTLRRSTDNGVTWATVNYSPGNCFSIKAGGTTWLAATNDASSSTPNGTSVAVSNDSGANWTEVNLVGQSIYDFTFVDGVWLGSNSSQIIMATPGDFSRWVVVTPTNSDNFWEFNNQGRWALRTGLDNAVWLSDSSQATWRSSDKGLTWVRSHAPTSTVMSGPNKRAVAVNRSTQADSVVFGILTGRPAAGIPYASIARAVNGGEQTQRAVMYIRIR